MSMLSKNIKVMSLWCIVFVGEFYINLVFVYYIIFCLICDIGVFYIEMCWNDIIIVLDVY